MKKFVTFIFALGVIAYLNGMTAYAQGKGRGQGAPAGAARSQTGKPAEHAKTEKADKDNKQAHEAKEARNDEKFEERIERNPALKAKVENLLPPGTNLKTAANGFSNEGQFIAALHVSKNLNIPFDQLKAQMTGSNSVSLGEAIQKLRPAMTEKQAKDAAQRAERQARVTEKTKPIS